LEYVGIASDHKGQDIMDIGFCPYNMRFTVRYYTKGGYATVCRLSVCLSVRPSVGPSVRDV